MITIENVSKRYRMRDGFKVVLENASVHLPERNIALLGANGAGKSTLLRMISGAEQPNSGRIVCDYRVSFPLGFAGSFNGSMSGIENALFTSRIYGQETERVVEFVKDFSELGEQLYMPVHTYSSGMRARLAFGVSLAIDFELYLVDEITAVGDARFRQRSREAFRSKLDSASILMVSHNMGSLRDYCDAGVVIENAQLVYYDDLEEAISHHERNMRDDRDQSLPDHEVVGAEENRAGNRASRRSRATMPPKRQAGAGKRALEREDGDGRTPRARVRLPRPGSTMIKPDVVDPEP